MKTQLRKEIMNSRDSQPLGEIESKSESIEEFFFSLPLVNNAKTILIYNSIRGEVRTKSIIEKLLSLGKNIVVPVTLSKDGKTTLCRLKNTADLKEGMFGVPEPCIREELAPDTIDLVIVPGIAFDDKGNRLGHGYGYYDRMLKSINAPLLALSFEMQLLREIPREEHDVPVDMIITEERIIWCKNGRNN